MLGANDLTALWLTAQLALVTTACLLVIGMPIAWWLANTRSRSRAPIAALVAMPLVLPPTVIGFYLLLWLGPDGVVGGLTTAAGWGTLPFTFTGLVVASVLYSLPFVVQPIENAFRSLGRAPLETAATLGAGPWDRFFTVALPLSMPGVITAAVLGFAHTVGEFGVVLMIGGNIPGVTQVASVRVYEQVESLDYLGAHALSLTLVGFSFVALLALYLLQGARGASLFSRDGRQQ
ncbi:MAG: molybdate ABC transporter permease subunit [Pseudomonadota bacterium]